MTLGKRIALIAAGAAVLGVGTAITAPKASADSFTLVLPLGGHDHDNYYDGNYGRWHDHDRYYHQDRDFRYDNRRDFRRDDRDFRGDRDRGDRDFRGGSDRYSGGDRSFRGGNRR